MLGYVRIYKDELKVREYELYRGLYCSLCKRLGKEYGPFSRLLLSYDATFLVLVALSVRSIRPGFKKGRCPFNLLKRCSYCLDGADEFSFAAAVSVMLFYFKVRDDIADSRFFRRVLLRLIYPYAKAKFRKASRLFPALALELTVLMDCQAELERTGSADVDEAADASAKALGAIFAFLNDGDDELRSFGYSLGRWVYLMDAADDIEDDIKTGSFNVFVNRFSLKSGADFNDEVKREVEGTLNLSVFAAIEHCKKLRFDFLLPIIENVLYDGTEAAMKNVLEHTEDNSGRRCPAYRRVT